MNTPQDQNETATSLIERMERETGQRIDSNNGDNNAVAGLMGALSRMMGKSPSCYKPQDDVAVGLYIKMTNSPEYKQREAEKDMAMRMFMADLGVEMPERKPDE